MNPRYTDDAFRFVLMSTFLYFLYTLVKVLVDKDRPGISFLRTFLFLMICFGYFAIPVAMFRNPYHMTGWIYFFNLLLIPFTFYVVTNVIKYKARKFVWGDVEQLVASFIIVLIVMAFGGFLF